MELFLKVHTIIGEAVEAGVSYGVNRAYKYADKPSKDAIKEHVEREVMNALSEVIDYEKYEIIESAEGQESSA